MTAKKDKEPSVPVKDVMTTPPITVEKGRSVDEVAKLMEKHDFGSIVVVDDGQNPIGIITERDIVTRLAAKNLTPNKIKAEEIMTKPLVTIEPNTDITEAAKKMSQLKIRRLAVVEKGKLVGMVTSKDILDITPALIDVIIEKSRATGFTPSKELTALAGYCDECATWSDRLRSRDGAFVCSDCYADLTAEKESE